MQRFTDKKKRDGAIGSEFDEPGDILAYRGTFQGRKSLRSDAERVAYGEPYPAFSNVQGEYASHMTHFHNLTLPQRFIALLLQ
jgi:hypothetical protein